MKPTATTAEILRKHAGEIEDWNFTPALKEAADKSYPAFNNFLATLATSDIDPWNKIDAGYYWIDLLLYGYFHDGYCIETLAARVFESLKLIGQLEIPDLTIWINTSGKGTKHRLIAKNLQDRSKLIRGCTKIFEDNHFLVSDEELKQLLSNN